MISQYVNICRACQGELKANAFLSMRFTDRRKGLSGSWQFVECAHCGIMSMVPLPTEEQLAGYYSAYTKDTRVNLIRRMGAKYPTLRKLFHWLSGDVDPRDFVEVPAGARVLDYGCGHASYLCDFHYQGVAISGAEIVEHLVNACRENGLDVHKVDDFSHVPFKDETFDVVYLMQVFEHLRDPRTSLKELYRVMKPRGMLYLALPNTASIWRKVFGENWVSGWFAPFHMFLYNSKNLTALAKKYDFEFVKSWSSTPELWFRLNLKAWLYPRENQLEWHTTWLDNLLIRYALMIFLRIVELPFRERDCLVLKLRKKE